MSARDSRGKKLFITGATDGLGKLVAKDAANNKAVVYIHGRNPEKGRTVLHELNNCSSNDSFRYYNADFSSLEEVNRLASDLLTGNEKLDILINNAAIGSGKASGNRRELGRDGIELRLAVNYFAHVLLTEKLLPMLQPGSVIINVASIGQEKLDFSDLMLEKDYDGYKAYKQSKTALIMYTFDLAERVQEKGIKVNAVHPASLMNTNMVIRDWGYTLTTVEEGAEAVENLFAPQTTGEYYNGLKKAKAISQSYDMKARSKLHEITWQYLGKYL